MRRRPKLKMVKNLLGEWVVSDESLEDLSRKGEQGMLFDPDLSPEERRARKLAEDHKAEGARNSSSLRTHPSNPDHKANRRN